MAAQEITLETVLAAQRNATEMREKTDQLAKDIVSIQKRLDRRLAETAAAEKQFAEIKASYEATLKKVR